MDEKDYELLMELHELKNITKVSQKLFISQPALTKRIKKMEEELDTELLLRSKKGVIFTPTGETIIPYARQILELSKQMKEQVSAKQGFVGGTLSLGSSLNFSHYRLPAILKEYTELYPRVDIQIVTGQSKELYQKLLRDEIAIAIVRGSFRWNEGFTLLCQEPMCLVCSNDHADTPLSDYPRIIRHTDANLTDRMLLWLSERGLAGSQSKLQIDNIDTCKEMARLGLGWAILPKICLDDFDGHVEELQFLDGTPFVRSTYILYKHSYYELPQVKLFLELLMSSVQ